MSAGGMRRRKPRAARTPEPHRRRSVPASWQIEMAGRDAPATSAESESRRARIVPRPYQEEVVRKFVDSELRMWALLWERQAGKSTTFADFALYAMMRFKGRTVIYGSASLLLAREITYKASIRTQGARELVEKEAEVLQQFATGAVKKAASRSLQFAMADASKGKLIKGGAAALKPMDFAELFEDQKLEFRVYHTRTRYSRTKVIAPNIATARSWSGTVLLDEIAFIRDLRELITALLPVISGRKNYKLILSTTPPEFDDTHYSYELLAPPAGRIFTPSASGNWYESESGIQVHRADAFDTELAGKKIYDLKTGEEISPAEAFSRAPNKDGHRIAHWLWWTIGGAAACDLLRLKVAQERGAGNGGNIEQRTSNAEHRTCRNFLIDCDADMTNAINWLAGNIDATARVGLGFDVATTTKGKSNPSAVSVVEEHGPEWVVRARFVWKTRDPGVADERLDRIIQCVERRAFHGSAAVPAASGKLAGGTTALPGLARAVALAQDATNEKYYAETTRKRLRSRLPVILVVASERVEKPGLDKPTNYKEYLGEQLVAKLDDNNLTLPPDAYTRTDYRLVMRDRGKFVCEPNDEGMHGDTFDADKLAGFALTASSSRRTIVAPPPAPLLPVIPGREEAEPLSYLDASTL